MRILVIEDEHRIAQSLQMGLEQERFQVELAYDGNTRYELASTNSFDVLIIDVMLPGLDGVSLCQKLRQQKLQTPILILTAKDQLESKVLGLNAGADDYLTKPFAFTELLARVRALLRRPPITHHRHLEFTDLQLDPQTFQVTRKKQHIQLSPKEFALLEYFLRHPNLVLTKDQLIEHVWEYDSDILPNTLEVTIRHLRQKIETPFLPQPRLIHTVRGYGYKLGTR